MISKAVIKRGITLLAVMGVMEAGLVACNDNDEKPEPCTEAYYRLSTPVIADETVLRNPNGFTMQLRFQSTLYAMQQQATPNMGLFVQSAVAGDLCPGGKKGSFERIKEVVITSLYDFDAAHPSGTSLNDLFSGELPGETSVIPLNDLLADHLYQRSLLPGEPAAISLYNRFISLYLTQWPSASELQVFKIKVTYMDGRTYTGTSGEVRFK